MSNTSILQNNILIGKCPCCQEYVSIKQEDIRCGIFRHAVYRNNFQPIPPHSTQEECETLVSSGRVYGCGKPFQVRLVSVEGEYELVECGYI